MEAGVPFSVVATLMGWSAAPRFACRSVTATLGRAHNVGLWTYSASQFLKVMGHKMGHNPKMSNPPFAPTN